MLRLDAYQGVSVCDGLTRRDFLHAGAVPLLGLTLPGFFAQRSAAATPDKDVNCIMLFLLGAPSHIDTWDPKPKAPAEVRGPYKPIATKATGMQISEIFPKMAASVKEQARRYYQMWRDNQFSHRLEAVEQQAQENAGP